jgi:hypothetical protein
MAAAPQEYVYGPHYSRLIVFLFLVMECSRQHGRIASSWQHRFRRPLSIVLTTYNQWRCFVVTQHAVTSPTERDGASLHTRRTRGPCPRERCLGRVLECGLAHPDVLEASGLNAEDYSGLAMDVGLDRLLMLHKGIDETRILRSADERIQRQMLALQPYRAVSAQPAIKHDMSIAVDASSLTPEELSDRVRTALGERCQNVEEIAIVSEVPYVELSTGARHRLGMLPHQKNVLLRLVIRDLGTYADIRRSKRPT